MCGGPAKRDADTMDTFVCSSWYFLRYPDSRNSKQAFDPAWINRMLPVDKYVGGAEHACMHLLYARFFTMALHDMGYVDFDEPFSSLVHQGVILGPDGVRMSKNARGTSSRRTNTSSNTAATCCALTSPSASPTLRAARGTADGIRSVQQVSGACSSASSARLLDVTGESEEGKKEIRYAENYAIRHVSADIENFSVQHGRRAHDGARPTRSPSTLTPRPTGKRRPISRGR